MRSSALSITFVGEVVRVHGQGNIKSINKINRLAQGYFDLAFPPFDCSIQRSLGGGGGGDIFLHYTKLSLGS